MDRYDIIAELAVIRLGINPEAPVFRMDRLARIGAHHYVHVGRGELSALKRAASKATRRAYRGARVRTNPASARNVF
jgi:hypothetical protein